MLDPIELLELRIEREMGKVDSDGRYPCTNCGHPTLLETMGPLNNSPDSPLICEACEKVLWDSYLTEHST